MVSKLSILVIIVSFIGYYIYGFLEHNGAFRKLSNINTESCYRIKDGNYGMEDIAMTNGNYALISNDDRIWFGGMYETMRNMTESQQSNIYVFNMNVPFKQRKLTVLPIDNIPASETQRHYHGIYLRLGHNKNDNDYLYVVTHTLLGEAIYIMKVNYKNNNKNNEPSSLTLTGIIRDPNQNDSNKILFKAINDIVSVSASDNHHIMYATNWYVLT